MKAEWNIGRCKSCGEWVVFEKKCSACGTVTFNKKDAPA